MWDQHVDRTDDRERHDGGSRRGQRVALPPPDRRHVVRPGPGEGPDHHQPGHLQHEDAAEEGEQVAPPAEADRRHDQHHREHEHRPSGGRPVHRVRHRGEPAGAEVDDEAQERGVDLVGDATGERREEGDHEPTDQHDGHDDPAPPRVSELSRQGRRGPGRSTSAPSYVSGGRHGARSVHLAAAEWDTGSICLSSHEPPPDAMTRRALRDRRSRHR